MAEYTIDKFTYGGNTYKLQDNVSGYSTNSGTVTSVRVQATAPVLSSNSSAQSTTLNTTISLNTAYGDTQNPYGSKTANYVLASPNGSAGNPSFRALVATDIPTLTLSKISDSGAAAAKAVDSTIAVNSTSVNVPTTAAVVAYVANNSGGATIQIVDWTAS